MFDMLCDLWVMRMVNVWKYIKKLRSIILLQCELFDLLMGEPQTPHFYDFGTFERVLSSQNQLCLSLETPGHLNKIKKKTTYVEKYYFYRSKNRDVIF